MAQAWKNVARNALRPAFLPVMLRKVLKRTERDTSAAATAWARERARPIDAYCAAADPALWAETTARCEEMRAEVRAKLDALGIDLGGGGAYPLLRFLVRWRRPEVVVETGVAAGWSSYAVLDALRANGGGRLLSSDFPYFRLDHPERYVGFAVPDDLRPGWHLDMRGDAAALPDIVSRVDRIDLFHYDSDKSASGRAFALRTAGRLIGRRGVVVMDDIQDNLFFRDWVAREHLPYLVFEFEGKFLGVVGLPSEPGAAAR
ncbi:MAG: class I SAM-dependent methyltransferase [Dehalococcoidia bacterium]